MTEMETVETLSERFENFRNKDISEIRNECSKIAQSITNNETTITNIVEQLEYFLTSRLNTYRKYGNCILTNVIDTLPNNFLTSDQLHFLCTFFSDRLKQNTVVIPTVLTGILSVLQKENIPEGACSTILTSLFHNVSCQNLQQADRYTEYSIFKVVLEEKEQEIKTMGLDFVDGVIMAIDGEQDPRNLMFIFKWLPTFLKTVDLKHLAEEMFDIISCYFPVDFPSMRDDEFSGSIVQPIHRDDLASALCRCLCAIPSFAEFCIPLALEKVYTYINVANIDSLELLFSGCETFPTEVYHSHATEIWPLLMREAIMNTNNEVQIACHKTVTAFIKKISENFTNETQEIIKQIMYSFKGKMQSTNRFLMQSLEVIKSITRAGLSPAKHISSIVFPQLINLFNTTNTADTKVQLLKKLVDLFIIYAQFTDRDFSDDFKLIPQLCVETAKTEGELQVIGLKGVAQIAEYINIESRNDLYEKFNTFIISSRNNQVEEAWTECIKRFAEVYPSEIASLIDKSYNDYNPDHFNKFITAFVCLGSMENFHDIVVRILLQSSVSDLNKSIISVRLLKQLLNKEIGNSSLFTYGFIECLITFILSANIEGANTDYFIDVGDILKMLIGNLNSAEQEELLKNTFVDDVLRSVNDRVVLVFIVDGLFESLRQDIVRHRGVLLKLMETAFDQDEHVREISVQLLANMVNKLKCDEELNQSIEEIESICEIKLSKDDSVERVCVVVSWITKALIMRGHGLSMKWIKKMLAILDQTIHIARGFKIVIKDSYNCLSTTKSYCNKRLLYQQLFFTTVCKSFKEHIKINPDKPNILLAYGYMLEEIPEQIVQNYFNENLQLFVLCLNNCQDASALNGVLTILYKLIKCENLLENHIHAFIPILLRLSKFQASMKVRILSLQCLSHFTSGYTLSKLLPLKMTVVTELAECIDDKKRLVRREATETRLQWFLIDAPRD